MSGPAFRGRGGRGFGGRGGRGGSLAGRGFGATQQNVKVTFSDEETPAKDAQRAGSAATATVPAEKSSLSSSLQTPATTMKTTVNSSGSEIPQRLNNKVFIDGLPFHHTPKPGEGSLEDQLAQFAQDWKIGRVMRLTKKDGQGFGYLAFRSPNSVDVAIRVLNGRKFLGRHLRVEAPKPSAHGGDAFDNNNNNNIDAAGGAHHHGLSSLAGAANYNRQILLSDLAKIAQPEVIREILRDVAPQLEERLVAIKMASGNRKAFLTLRDEADVEPGVRFLNGLSLFGRNVCAEKAMPPGSLPYSKAKPLKPAVTTAAGTTPFSGAAKTSPNEDDDGPVDLVPLGAKPLPNPTALKPVATGSTPVKSAPPVQLRTIAAKYNPADRGSAEIYVGNVSELTTAAQLRTHFSTCGLIHTCELMYNPTTKLPLGIARIEFAAPSGAAVAQQSLHGSRLNGAVLRVDRGGESSAPLASEELSKAVQQRRQREEDEIDEDAFLEHHGVRNKKKYFEGSSKKRSGANDDSSFEVVSGKRKQAKTEAGRQKTKRPRDASNSEAATVVKKKKPRTEK
jgi:RNA recognition motif-containing protein